MMGAGRLGGAPCTQHMAPFSQLVGRCAPSHLLSSICESIDSLVALVCIVPVMPVHGSWGVAPACIEVEAAYGVWPCTLSPPPPWQLCRDLPGAQWCVLWQVALRCLLAGVEWSELAGFVESVYVVLH